MQRRIPPEGLDLYCVGPADAKALLAEMTQIRQYLQLLLDNGTGPRGVVVHIQLLTENPAERLDRLFGASARPFRLMPHEGP